MKRRFAVFVFLLLCLLLLAAPAAAMYSTNYAVDWNTGLSGTGGSSQSAHYAIHLTVGQTGIGGEASTNYAAGLGFWYGRLIDNITFVPVARK